MAASNGMLSTWLVFLSLHANSLTEEHSRRLPNLQVAARLIKWEILFTSRLIQSNAIANIGSFTVGIVSRFIAVTPPVLAIIPALWKTLLTSVAFCYCFEAAHQVMSVQEDAINKPYRPIPSGLISLESTRRRWIISWLFVPVMMYVHCGESAAAYFALWLVGIFHSYVWPRPTHWIFRNAFSTWGLFFLLRMENAIVSQEMPQWTVRVWADIASALYCMATIHVQEFHDVEGDRKTGRKTLAVILSPTAQEWLRTMTALFFVICGGVFFIRSIGHSMVLLCTAALHFVATCVVAYRTTHLKTKFDDERTYRHYYYVSSFLLIAHIYLLDLAEA